MMKNEQEWTQLSSETTFYQRNSTEFFLDLLYKYTRFYNKISMKLKGNTSKMSEIEAKLMENQWNSMKIELKSTKSA